MKILCCGFFPALQRTLEYKTFRPGEVNRARTVSLSVGGKATNTSRVLAALGADPLMISFIGGATGETTQAIIDAEGWPCDWIETDAETRVCQTLLSDDNSPCTELVEDSAPLTPREWKNYIQAFQRNVSDENPVIFSGNIPKHAPQDIYAKLLSLCDADHVLIDTSGDALLAALKHRPALVKINAEELSNTLKESGTTEELAHELIDRGAQAVGITAGKGSALLVTPNETTYYRIPTIDAVNPIGSGDSVSAGTVYAWSQGAPLKEAFAFGLACGTSNAMNREPGRVELQQIAEIAPQITPTTGPQCR